jgi:hypothetical protein
MLKRLALSGLFLLIAAFGYTAVMGRLGGGPAPTLELDQPNKQADLITVNKQERRMFLWREGVVLAEYRIALGAAANDGAKQREGDVISSIGAIQNQWRTLACTFHIRIRQTKPLLVIMGIRQAVTS